MRTWLCAAALLMVAPACSTSDVGAGSDGEHQQVGELALSLELGGFVIDTVHFEITGNGFERTGDLAVDGPGANFAFTIHDIPAGMGYRVRLTALPADSGVGCVGEATFDIAPATTTLVNVVFACDELQNNSGNVAINGTFNICPSVQSTTASPAVQALGGRVELTSQARDVDNAPLPLRYSWSSTSDGSFEDRDAPRAAYLCTSVGSKSIVLTVTDTLCAKSSPAVTVRCVEAPADGGVDDAGLDGGDSASDAGADAGDAAGPDAGDAELDAGPDASDAAPDASDAGPDASDAGPDADAGTGPALVRINEIESRGGVPADWLELYNAGTGAQDLTGWVLRDENKNHVYNFPAGATIAGEAYLVLEQATLGYGFGDADSTRLFAPNDVLVDGYTWTTPALATYGRCPTASSEITTTAKPTKGAANQCGPAVPPRMVINEVESQAGGGQPDWVELFNSDAETLDLSGWSLRGNGANAIYTIPEGTMLASGQYLVIEQTQFGYGLGASESVRLVWIDGTTQVDISTWTAHAANTWGRCPNGTGAFRNTSASTKLSANSCL